MAWSAPRFCSRVLAAPPRSSTGDWAIWAFFTAVTVLVRPGPAVTATTPTVPVRRATASAANTAVTSWRVSTTRMPSFSQATSSGEICPPTSVKRNFTPCALSTAATLSPPCRMLPLSTLCINRYKSPRRCAAPSTAATSVPQTRSWKEGKRLPAGAVAVDISLR